MRAQLKLFCTAVVIGALIALPTTAGAHFGARRDGNDVRGALDIDVAGFLNQSGQIQVMATMQSGESLDLLTLTEPNRLIFNFDTDGDGGWERAAGIYYEDGALVGALIKNAKGTPKLVGTGLTDFKFGAISISFPKSFLALNGRKIVRWSVMTSYKAPGACTPSCKDYAPSKTGWYKHNLSTDGPIVGSPLRTGW